MPVCFSVLNLRGYNDKYNTVLYREPIIENEDYEPKYVIFFPGDYSNFFTNSIYTSFKTAKDFECTTYCYSYEALFWVVSEKYLSDHLIFIKPSIFQNYFVHFSNFVNDICILEDGTYIEHNTNLQSKEEVKEKAVSHLSSLLVSLNEELRKNNKHKKEMTDTSNKNAKGDIIEETHELILIGFSKGCSVLIALLNEMKEKYVLFWGNVKSILFLDPGFNKSVFRFSICEESLKTICKYKLKIIVHSTLRQIYDEHNSCIHKRVFDFLSMLKKWNIPVSSYLHYDYVNKSKSSISFHFEILTDFFEDITESSYYVFLLNLENAENDKNRESIEKNKVMKRKENFLFDGWHKYCIFD